MIRFDLESSLLLERGETIGEKMSDPAAVSQ